MRQLVSLDTNQIKKYVFATGKLKEIRGASAILDELNRIDMVEIAHSFGAKKIYANGGSGMFVIDSEHSQNFIQTVQKLYREKTLTASISGAAIDLPDTEDIQPYLKNLAYRLRMGKDANPKFQSAVSHAFIRTCDSCGEQYAVTTDDDELLCESCANKRSKDEMIKAKIRKQIRSESDADERKLWHHLINELQNSEYQLSEKTQRPADFDKLGKCSTPRNYMGLIYADGNSMGKELEKIKKQDDLTKFSESVDGAIFDSVLTAVKQHLKPRGKILPFDILLLGGDDLVMVTTADKVIDVAITITEKFREFTEESYGEPLSLSIGVVIAHAKFPFGSLLSLAESALKSAKKEGAKRQLDSADQSQRDSEGGLINFMVVNSSSSLDFKNYFQEELKFESNNSKFHRTLRPYNVSELKAVQEAIRQFKDFPRNKIQNIRESIFLSKNQSFLKGLTVLSRLKKKQRTDLTAFLNHFAVDSDLSIFPWFKKDCEYFTPFLDLIDLYNFIV